MFRTTSLLTLALCGAVSLVAHARPEGGRLAQNDTQGTSDESSGWFGGDSDSAASEPRSSDSEAATPETEKPSAPAKSDTAKTKAASKGEAAGASVRTTASTDPVSDRTTDVSTRRGRHLHDGFYLRLSLGGGSLGAQGERLDANGDSTSYEFRGGAFASELLVGGTPMPGLTLGGAYLGAQGARQGTDETRADSFMTLAIVGPFIDVFPNPRGGFHLGGALGPAATASYSDRGALSPATTTSYGDRFEQRSIALGFGGSIWAGYDFWISDNWSLGASLRFSGARVETPDSGHLDPASPDHDRLGVGSGAILISALYH